MKRIYKVTTDPDEQQYLHAHASDEANIQMMKELTSRHTGKISIDIASSFFFFTLSSNSQKVIKRGISLSVATFALCTTC